jgi:hypothetical protein
LLNKWQNKLRMINAQWPISNEKKVGHS